MQKYTKLILTKIMTIYITIFNEMEESYLSFTYSFCNSLQIRMFINCRFNFRIILTETSYGISFLFKLLEPSFLLL
jgi:hypothetical protein